MASNGTDSEKAGIRKAKTEHASRGQRRGLANPVPMGLMAFGCTTWLLSMFIVHTRDVHTNNLIVGMALFFGGLVQFMAGQWSVAYGDTYASAALSAYGAFWMSYATLFIPNSGVIAAFGGENEEFHQAFGIYLMLWFVITIMYMLPMLRKNISFVIMLAFLALTYLLLAIGSWNQKESVNNAGGAFGIITGLVAWYIVVGMLMDEEPSALFRLPMGVLSE